MAFAPLSAPAVPPIAGLSYAELLRRLYAYERSGMRLGLDGPRRLHNALGAPEQAFRAIQVAGTNGKGTAAACLAAILRAAGCRTGLYTSPHLLDFSERIRVDGQALAREAVERHMRVAAPAAEAEGASYFETVTALGALAFREAAVEWAVTEVGIGGRLDATTVWPSLLGGITAIDFDHTEILGDTLEAIAAEKAGIARSGGVVISSESREPARTALAHQVARRGARLLEEGRDWSVTVTRVDDAGATLDIRLPDGAWWRALQTPLLGAHQARNAALAAVLAWACGDARVVEAAVRAGLARVSWPGRGQVIEVARPGAAPRRVLCDVAHNPAAAGRLTDLLALLSPRGRRLACVGMLADKDAAGFAAALGPALAGVVVTTPASARARTAADLAELFAPHTTVLAVEPAVPDAIAALLTLADDGDALCVVTGSCYTVGESLPALGVANLDVI